MYVSASPLLPVSEDVFEDGLGRRLQVWNSTTDQTFEVLRFHAVLSNVPSFEFALRERVRRLEGFDHPSFAHAQAIARTAGAMGDLLLRSNLITGVRLSQMLESANARGLNCDLETAVCVIRQLVVALAALHKYDPDIAHGAISPDRIVITPTGQLVVVEHVLAPALEEL